MNKIIFLMFLVSFSGYAQNLDSLYNRLMGTMNSDLNTIEIAQIDNNQPSKCGFGLVSSIKVHYNEFSLAKQKQISEILSQPELDTSIVSPSGYFRIHYDTTGNNVPNYDNLSIEQSVYEVAIAFDSSYNFEVNYLGYPEPPSDGTFGGDDKYDVYIQSIGDYGFTDYTDPEYSLGNHRYISHIVFHNTFRGNFNSHGVAAARVTAAHEFHHAIQLGNYRAPLNDEEKYYYELTSTAFEEFVYDEVNDYYAYMPSFFRNTNIKLEENTGYNLAVWNLFLKEQFFSEDPMLGYKIIKKSWELLGDTEKTYTPINAIDVALATEISSSFRNEYLKFAEWIYFTNFRAKNGEYFEEAEFYPLIKETNSYHLESSIMPVMVQSEPRSINYLQFFDLSEGFNDTLLTILTNHNISSNSSSSDLYLKIERNSFSGATPINEHYFKKLDGTNDDVGEGYFVNGILASSILSRTSIDFAFPQPFRYERLLSIPTFPDISGRAEFYIYSSDMNLVYRSTESISTSGKIVINWDGLDKNGNRLASGVYVFVTRSNDKIKKGKLVILNQ